MSPKKHRALRLAYRKGPRRNTFQAIWNKEYLMLKRHNRYHYLPIVGRERYEWPNGTRLAIFTALNVEAFPFAEGLGVELAPGQPQPDVVNYSWRDYGNRVGFWRLLELLDEFKIPASMLMNTEIFDECPQIADAILKRGDEIVGHGRTNAERQGQMSEEDERHLIGEVVELIQSRTGTRPFGWLGPWVSESHVTLDLLQEAGFTYHMDWMLDDQPIWMTHKRLLHPRSKWRRVGRYRQSEKIKSIHLLPPLAVSEFPELTRSGISAWLAPI
jgi:peptidoglycan/xylan/chitin deacetylase (PgdA/CDA1 family)